MSTTNVLFHLSKGNPAHNKVGIGEDLQVYGKSVGGEIFRQNLLPNGKYVYHNLNTQKTYDVFDPIVPSDIIKNQINYRAIFITNYGVESIILNSLTVSDVEHDPKLTYAITDVDIAVEGIFTNNELNRKIPGDVGKPQNPSIYLDDEYDSTQKLQSLTFKKELLDVDLPVEIPYDCSLKVWIRRVMTVDKINMPEEVLDESFTLTLEDYLSETYDLTVGYAKLKGRIPLSNWYMSTITLGNGKPFILKELFPKEVDISEFNIIKTFVHDDKIIIYYYQVVNNINEYYLLVVKPNDIADMNKYVHVRLKFAESDDQYSIDNKIVKNIYKSFYNNQKYYIFWDEYNVINDICTIDSFNKRDSLYSIGVHEIDTFIWANDIFNAFPGGWSKRKYIEYDVLSYKKIRNHHKIINVEQFDDLFILFTQSTENKDIQYAIGDTINVIKNNLLYVFEKDIDDSEKYSQFKHFHQGGTILSHRLIPESLPSITQTNTINHARNSNINVIISDIADINNEIHSPREIRYLLDNSRYVYKNSFHNREFKIGNRFISYEIPVDNDFSNLSVTCGMKITNDDVISTDADAYNTNYQLDNEYNGEIYERPWFQQNIIDVNSMTSKSIPKEWVSRIYNDTWFEIAKSLPYNGESLFTLKYNFNKNHWLYTINGIDTIINNGNVAGIEYKDLNIVQYQNVIEPSVYFPISIKVNTQKIYSGEQNKNLFKVSLSVYFKNNDMPLLEWSGNVDNIKHLSNFIFNPSKQLDISINYLKVQNIDEEPYVNNNIKTLHSTISNNDNITLSKEMVVDTIRYPQQTKFKYYRTISLGDISNYIKSSNDITIPLILYGTAYTNTSDTLLNDNIEVINPIEFKKININDRTIRFYTNNNFDVPLSFKVSHYDYEKDYCVMWVRLRGITKSTKLYMFYGTYDTIDDYSDFVNSYLNLSSKLYSDSTMGAWHFDIIKKDSHIVFNNGRIFNIGEPMFMESSIYNDIRLTKIEKEYMYGLAKIFKSHKFNVEIDVPKEDSLVFDKNMSEEFKEFITSTTRIFKPSYTEMNDITHFSNAVMESGSNKMGISNNKKLSGLTILTPNENVNTYYNRVSQTKFNILTSLNGFDNKIDWVVSQPIDTKLFKAGTYKVNGNLVSETIYFENAFPDSNYYIFLSNPVNQKVYWSQICQNKFTITSSHTLKKEISWMAFHRDIFGGVYTPNSIYCGRRIITGYTETPEQESPTVANLSSWYNNELYVKPQIGVDIDPGDMLIDPENPGYSLILSCNKNINMYWTEKSMNSFRIKTSSPYQCIIHWLVIKNGIEWWQELL